MNQLALQDHRHLVNVLGYSPYSVHNTFSLVKKLGATDPYASSSPASTDAVVRRKSVLDDKYRSLVRQLPSKEYIDILVQQFFSKVNWHYDVLDEITFHQQLGSWRRFPYSAHSQAISSLPTDILAFPSLLFQLMAHSLIHQPIGEQASPSLETLKYAPEMTFVELAKDFSEAGYSMIEIIDKEDVSVVAVQAGILRASFLKNTGSVIEAWHVVGTTISMAQEIGLHANMAVEDSSRNIDALWDHEMRRRVWFVLHNWDIHMAVVLGRPMTTVVTAENVDVPDSLAQRESGTPPRRRTDQDAPTPFSVIRVGYDTAFQYFPRIRDLENSGARTNDYRVVVETHAAIVESMNRIPRWCRHEDPDANFDELPSCSWLPAARQSLASGIYFVLLALHRPYVFSVPESRTEALKAALMIFTTHSRLFDLSESNQYLAFNMVYPLFDAMVVSLAVLLLFPNENFDIHARLIEGVYWATNVLADIGRYNAMARSANGVVETLLSRLGGGPGPSLRHMDQDSEEGASENRNSGMANLHALEGSQFPSFDLNAPNLTGSPSLIHHQALTTMLTPPNFDVGTLSPPRPVSDLFYQDVHATSPEILQGAETPMRSLQFDGNYSDDSFWNFINDLSRA